jgi:hypothetical protein
VRAAHQSGLSAAHALIKFVGLGIRMYLGCRWEGAAQRGTAWLGQALDPVRIEVQGKFTFVLVKVENRQGSSRLLVRGRQGCSQAALMQDVEKEVCFVLHALVHACIHSCLL